MTSATILTDEIDSAVPRNNALIRRCPDVGNIDAGSRAPSAQPQANGTTMPHTET